MHPSLLLQTTLPVFDVNEIHSIHIRATPKQIWDVLQGYRFGSSPLFRVLFGLRKVVGLPTVLVRRQPILKDWNFEDPPLLQLPAFVKVAERANLEVVVGMIGKFWQPVPRSVIVENAEAFARFSDPTYGKVAMNFYLEPAEQGGTRLSTETRVQVPDPKSLFLFRMYWAVIGAFSGWLRIDMLRRVKYLAESGIA